MMLPDVITSVGFGVECSVMETMRRVETLLPPDLADAAKAKAEDDNISVGEVVRIALAKFIGVDARPVRRGRPPKRTPSDGEAA